MLRSNVPNFDQLLKYDLERLKIPNFDVNKGVGINLDGFSQNSYIKFETYWTPVLQRNNQSFIIYLSATAGHSVECKPK